MQTLPAYTVASGAADFKVLIVSADLPPVSNFAMKTGTLVGILPPQKHSPDVRSA